MARKERKDGDAANDLFASASPSLFRSTPLPLNQGLDGLSQTFIHYAYSQIEDVTATLYRLLSCRSLDDMTAIQEEFVQKSFDRLIDEASKIAQTTVNMAKDTVVPLNDEMENVVQKLRDLSRPV